MQFFLRHATTLSPDLRARLAALAELVDATGRLAIPRREFYHRYVTIQGAWRRAGLAAYYQQRQEAPVRARRKA